MNASYTALRLYKFERSQAVLTESQQAPVLAAFYLPYVRNPDRYGPAESGMKISASMRLSEKKLEQARADLAHIMAANLLPIEVDHQPNTVGKDIMASTQALFLI